MTETCITEEGDCFIRSLCALWGKPYEYCRCVAHRYGFNDGMPLDGILELLGPQELGGYEPVCDWAIAHRRGRFLVETSGHVLSVIDGIFEESVYCDRPVLGYWEMA